MTSKLSDNRTVTRRGSGLAPSSCFVPQPGLRIDGLLLIRELGRGGMGVVFEADDPELNRRVAVKFLHPNAAAAPINCKRFVREAKSIARAMCDFVVPIHYFGQEAGVSFLVMPLLIGETLRDRLKKGPLSLVEAVRIACELARALDVTHSCGLIHRDIKPSNCWLDAGTGRARLMDFGLARHLDGSDALTIGSEPQGTFTYMAPEQLDGRYDSRTDLFGYGLVLYEMLAGCLPFPRPACALLTGSVLQPLPARVPPSLATLVGRLLSVSPDDRFPSARGVLDILLQ